MAVVELTRQEIWTILCWAGDFTGDEGELPSYNMEEASIVSKLQIAMAEEDARLKARAAAVRDADHANRATS